MRIDFPTIVLAKAWLRPACFWEAALRDDEAFDTPLTGRIPLPFRIGADVGKDVELIIRVTEGLSASEALGDKAACEGDVAALVGSGATASVGADAVFRSD